MAKDKLSENNHWDHIHKNKSIGFLNFGNIFEGLQNYMYFDIIKKYVISEHKSIFEIGCAPGNYLIRFYKKFGLIPNGIEYTLSGVEKTNNNFTNSHINGNIIFGDFFDKNFIVENTEKYDIVYSLGFIEHFENIENVIQNHFKLAKKGGLVVISLPNLRYINNLFTENKILEIHNLKIMDLDIIKKYFHKYNIKEIKYNGGLLNLGLFYYKNPILDKIRLILFIIQRLIFDPLFILLYKVGIDLSNKYTSPQILIICKKD